MKMYLPFGDWSGDGHKQFEKILIDAPSMDHLLEAQKQIKAKYGEFFFSHFADSWEDSSIGDDVFQALEDTNYPFEKFIKLDDVNDWSELSCIEQLRSYDKYPSFSLDLIIDMFIWLLNAYGAQIVCLEESENIPTICNWTCSGFETVGYGCFY